MNPQPVSSSGLRGFLGDLASFSFDSDTDVGRSNLPDVHTAGQKTTARGGWGHTDLARLPDRAGQVQDAQVL